MKRQSSIIGIGAALVILAYFGYPILFKNFGPYARREPKPRNLRAELGDVGPIYRCAQQPGLSFFTDLDEVKFSCYRSFDGSIEITVTKSYFEKGKPPELIAVQRFAKN